MRLGVFGGTFDPPHIGHLVAAQDALLSLGLDRVLLVPAAAPPHKLDRVITPGTVRLELLRAAVEDDPRFVVDDIELGRAGPSWTIDTLRAFHERWPEADLVLILGMDQFAEFESWREPEQIQRLARVAVLARAGVAAEPAGAWTPVPVTRIDITSTGIRERVAAGLPIRYLVPDPVVRLIEHHGLYRTADGAGTGPASKGYDKR